MIEGLGVEVIGVLGTVINKIATGLTIQTAIGSDWQALSDIKAQKNFDRLSDMIDYDEVRKDLEPYIETVDGYIAKHHQNLNESLLSAGYREQFVETFYKTHTQCLGMKADCDVYLEKYLDKLEHVLGSRMSEGEKIIWKSVERTERTAADTNNTVNGIQETVNETKEIVSETLDRRLRNLENQIESAIKDKKENGSETAYFESYYKGIVGKFCGEFGEDEKSIYYETKVKEREGEEIKTLDFVEKWYKNSNEFSFLYISGPTKTGKTSFCQYAVYEHHKKGWLAGVKIVIVDLALEPHLILNESDMTLKEDVIISRLRIDPKDLESALIFFDGYDRLYNYWSGLISEVKAGKILSGIKTYARQHSMKAIITLREACIKTVRSSVELIDCCVSIITLNSEDQRNYIKKYIDRCDKGEIGRLDDKDKERVKKYMDRLGQIDTIGGMLGNISVITEVIRHVADKYRKTDDEQPENEYYRVFFEVYEKYFPQDNDEDINEKLRDFFWRDYLEENNKSKNTKSQTDATFRIEDLDDIPFIERLGRSISVKATILVYYYAAQMIVDRINNGTKERDWNGLHRAFWTKKLNNEITKYISMIYSQNSEPSDIKENMRNLLETAIDYDCIIDQYGAIKGKNRQLGGFIDAYKIFAYNIAKVTTEVYAICSDSLKITEIYRGLLSISNMCFSESEERNYITFKGFEWGSENDKVDLSHIMLDHTHFYGEQTKGVSEYGGPAIEHVIMDGSSLRQVVFENVELVDVSFRIVNLERVKFKNVKITNSSFCGANLERAELEDVVLNNCTFENADLQKVKMEGVQINDCRFKNANLSETVMNHVEINDGTLENSCLEKIKTSSVKLTRVDLKYTILEGASLEGVEKKEIINERNVIPKGILDKVKTIDENEEDSINYRYTKDDMYDEDSYG